MCPPQITATKLGVGETIINDFKNISDKVKGSILHMFL